MSASPEKPDWPDGASEHSGKPKLSDVELESAFLKCVVVTRPVGPHKHVLMIQLQAQLRKDAGVWLPISELWTRLEDLCDIAALDSMSSPEPIPDSPRSLSPLPRPSKHARNEAGPSLSPLSNPSRSTSPPQQSSKSAELLNSSYFGQPFTLPYFRLGQEHWKDNIHMPAKKERRRSRSIASTSTQTETERGFMIGDEDPEMSGGEELDWKKKIYEENDRCSRGVDVDAEEEKFAQGVEEQLTVHDAEETKPAKGKSKKKGGRPSKARKEKEDTSDLSEGEGEVAEEEEEAETPKAGGRSKRPNAGKRKRDSNAKEESEEEKAVKDTVSLSHRFTLSTLT